MYPERFTERFRVILPRFHDIPADSRQLSWVLQQFDICFEANSSRFSSLVQALGHHLREQSQWILHLPAILNAFRRFTHRFRHILKRFPDIPADSRQISGILQQFDIRFEANSSRVFTSGAGASSAFSGAIPMRSAQTGNFKRIPNGLPSVFATF